MPFLLSHVILLQNKAQVTQRGAGVHVVRVAGRALGLSLEEAVIDLLQGAGSPGGQHALTTEPAHSAP